MLPAFRYDIYAFVHKGLRCQLSHTLSEIGRLDVEDAEDVTAKLGALRGLLATCKSHLEHEDAFVHRAMHARRPGSASNTAADHVEHLHALAELEQLAL